MCVCVCVCVCVWRRWWWWGEHIYKNIYMRARVYKFIFICIES